MRICVLSSMGHVLLQNSSRKTRYLAKCQNISFDHNPAEPALNWMQPVLLYVLSTALSEGYLRIVLYLTLMMIYTSLLPMENLYPSLSYSSWTRGTVPSVNNFLKGQQIRSTMAQVGFNSLQALMNYGQMEYFGILPNKSFLQKGIAMGH